MGFGAIYIGDTLLGKGRHALTHSSVSENTKKICKQATVQICWPVLGQQMQRQQACSSLCNELEGALEKADHVDVGVGGRVACGVQVVGDAVRKAVGLGLEGRTGG